MVESSNRINVSQIKERVETSRKAGKYSIIWDKTGNAANYFKTFEKMNMFGATLCG